MVVQAKARKFSDTELFAQDPFRVVAMENPVFETAFHASCSFEKGSLRSLKELLRTRKERFSWMEKLQFVAKRFVGIGPGKFRGLEFTSREIHESETNRRSGSVLGN